MEAKPSWFIFSFLFFLIALLSPKIATATSVTTWQASTGIGFLSQEIKVSASNHNIVYASLRTATGSGLFKSTDQGATFFNVFEVLPNRDVNSIAISYINPDKFCIGTYEQGIFCTTNGPANLTNNGWVSEGLIGKSVRYVTADPSNQGTYYAGTGQNNDDGGIYKTTNDGQSWAKVGDSTFGSKNCLNIIVSKNNSQELLAGSDYNLYFSTDAGLNWSPLPLGYTNSPATLFDITHPSLLYSAMDLFGVYKSLNKGADWQTYNSGIQNAMIFRLSQNESGELFASRRNTPGGIWKNNPLTSDLWENISDPSWGDRNTWGLDVGGNRVFVAVEGLGIYYADIAQPTPPSTSSNPIVIIPGFGASWSYRGLIENQTTSYADWQMLPFFTDDVYGPLISSFEQNGFVKNKDLFIFAYDFRKSIKDTAQSLKQFIDEEVVPNNVGKKIRIVAHSMGGLIARQCVEKVTGCFEKVEKIVTAGSPHQGTLKAYKLWEGGVVDDSNVVTRTIEEAAIDALNPLYLTRKDIIQNRFPGVRDFLPTFDYVLGKSYSALSTQAKNLNLESLVPVSSGFANGLLTLSGNTQETESQYITIEPQWWEKILGLWTDGKPTSSFKDLGDGTVLKKSSEILISLNKYYPGIHTDYFKSQDSINDIFSFFGIATPSPIPMGTPVESFTMFVIHSPAIISVTNQSGSVLGFSDSGKAVFVPNLEIGEYIINITGTAQGDYVLEILSSRNNKVFRNTLAGSTEPGKTDKIAFLNTGNETSLIRETNYSDLYKSLLSRLKSIDHSNQIATKVRFFAKNMWQPYFREKDEEIENERFDDFRGNARFGVLLSLYRDMGKLLAKEPNSAKREVLKQAAGDLEEMILNGNRNLKLSDYKLQKRIDQLGRSLEKVKRKPTIIDSLNHVDAEEYLSQVRAELNVGETTRAYILTFLIATLV